MARANRELSNPTPSATSRPRAEISWPAPDLLELVVPEETVGEEAEVAVDLIDEVDITEAEAEEEVAIGATKTYSALIMSAAFSATP